MHWSPASLEISCKAPPELVTHKNSIPCQLWILYDFFANTISQMKIHKAWIKIHCNVVKLLLRENIVVKSSCFNFTISIFMPVVLKKLSELWVNLPKHLLHVRYLNGHYNFLKLWLKRNGRSYQMRTQEPCHMLHEALCNDSLWL